MCSAGGRARPVRLLVPCGGLLRFIATLEDPRVVGKILAHLGLLHPGPAPPSAPVRSDNGLNVSSARGPERAPAATPNGRFSGRVGAMASFTVTCPCCNGRLTIDPALEAVIAHEPPPRQKSGVGLDEALTSLKGAAAKRAERFKEQMKAERSKPKVLDRMFQEGLKKAKDDPDPPINPMDLD